ncbi:MAG: Na(+)/H(+) antiporter subunit D [Hyphomonadaceae bacterium]|nr:Na(+)/H(+) antiporter subunit D [Hyphomonadaceae bacterium]
MTVDRLIDILATINPGFFVIAAALLAAVAKDVVLRAIALIGGPAIALVVLLYPPVAGIEVSKQTFLGYSLAFYRPDSLSLIFGFGFVLAAALGGIYSLHRRDRMQDAAGLVYAGSAMGAVFAGDMISLVVFAELATITSAVLVFATRTAPAYRAGLRYLAIQMIAGLMLTAGVAMYGVAQGTFLLAELGGLWNGVLVGIFDLSQPGALLILGGIGVKAAFPLVHNWLTDAYPNTTETGGVVMSPYTTTLAVYVLARGFAGLEWLVWIGAIMTVYPVFFAVMENDLKKVLAYSTNNQIGFMVCAVGIGTPLALNGAAAHAVAHMIFKGLLFMAMGAVQMRLGTTKATDLGGLHRTMPYTTIACLIGAASISALPFFAGYSSKAMIMTAAEGGPGLFVIWLMLLFASAGVLEHSGIKIPFFAFFSHDSGKRPQEAPFNMLLAMGLSAVICMSIGMSPHWFYQLMPFRDQALEYLALDLFSPSHIVQQLELLCFAVLAFMVLKWLKLYPAERPGVILDAEWLWRKALPSLGRSLARPASAPGRAISALSNSTVARVVALARNVFATGGVVSRKVPLAATAVWTLAILGLVVAVSLFS